MEKVEVKLIPAVRNGVVLFAVEKVGVWFTSNKMNVGANFIPPEGMEILVDWSADPAKEDWILTKDEFLSIVDNMVKEFKALAVQKEGVV